MRAIHYDMILSRPYYIGCNPDIRNFNGIQETESIKWPGMRMIVEDCDDIEKFFASFRYDCVDNMHPKFERQIAHVLQGNLPEWKLMSVDVSDAELRLGFMNEVLFEKYFSRCQAVKVWNGAHPRYQKVTPPPFYAESAISYKPDVGAKLRLELDNPVDGSTEITIISFCQGWENSVIELSENKGRSFTFQCGRHPINQYPVKVREWMI